MDYIIAKQDKLTAKLKLSDILYIGTKAERPRILEFVTDEGIYESYGKIKDFEEKIGLTFRRCHRKYLVNLRRVKAIDSKDRKIIFDNNSISPIECSRRHMVEVTRDWKTL